MTEWKRKQWRERSSESKRERISNSSDEEERRRQGVRLKFGLKRLCALLLAKGLDKNHGPTAICHLNGGF
jgi:hypothetical protein